MIVGVFVEGADYSPTHQVKEPNEYFDRVHEEQDESIAPMSPSAAQ